MSIKEMLEAGHGCIVFCDKMLTFSKEKGMWIVLDKEEVVARTPYEEEAVAVFLTDVMSYS
ncbi:MAG: hypothetical protein AB1442_00645 [Nitrospirota bacterium]